MDTYIFEIQSFTIGTFSSIDLAYQTCSYKYSKQYQIFYIHTCARTMKSRKSINSFLHFTYLTSTLYHVYIDVVVSIDANLFNANDITLLPYKSRQASSLCKICLCSQEEVDPKDQLLYKKCYKKGHNCHTYDCCYF